VSGPLSGIRVVDFSRVLAGPLCARTLLDLGAEVIKVEPPRPDVSRFALPSTNGMSGYYAQQNAGKRNVSIDLTVPGARELALRLCDTADIIVENFRAGLLRAGLPHAVCSQPTADLCVDHRLRPARSVARAHGICAYRAG
jgi:crotonobetainyl-CoA:carnitine CoA-transferase CaiB-like acyl-CoA transferase